MDCPRCGATLTAYSFGDLEGVGCDRCGYVGVPADHGSDPVRRESWTDALARYADGFDESTIRMRTVENESALDRVAVAAEAAAETGSGLTSEVVSEQRELVPVGDGELATPIELEEIQGIDVPPADASDTPADGDTPESEESAADVAGEEGDSDDADSEEPDSERTAPTDSESRATGASDGADDTAPEGGADDRERPEDSEEAEDPEETIEDAADPETDTEGADPPEAVDETGGTAEAEAEAVDETDETAEDAAADGEDGEEPSETEADEVVSS